MAAGRPRPPAQRTSHAFLDDIAHHAVPFGDHDGNPASRRRRSGHGPTAPPTTAGTYDDELLDAHFITGDGRGNENIGLTAVHHVFHSEHNRLVGHIKDVVLEAEGPRSSTSGSRCPSHAVPADRSGRSCGTASGSSRPPASPPRCSTSTSSSRSSPARSSRR